jgi:hypothetical protein
MTASAETRAVLKPTIEIVASAHASTTSDSTRICRRLSSKPPRTSGSMKKLSGNQPTSPTASAIAATVSTSSPTRATVGSTGASRRAECVLRRARCATEPMEVRAVTRRQ